MSYKISGSIGTDSRILVFDETTGTITGNELVSSGEYEVLDVGEGSKTVLARKSDGETVGYGNISPIFYEAFGLLHTLDNPNVYGTSEYDQFGDSVAISGDNCIVGVPYEDEVDEAEDSGKAYIFSVTTGNLLQTLDNPNPYGGPGYDRFGGSVAISGNRCIVCAAGEDEAGNSGSGKVYIFDVTTGNLLQTLDNPNAYDTAASDGFGGAAAIDGNKCIVGATGEDDAGGLSSGKAYIFDVTTGNILQTLDNPNAYAGSSYDYFGKRVAISGNKCIISATGEDDASGGNSGKAYIFDVTTGNLLQTLDNPNAYGTSAIDYFGSSLAIYENTCIVGANYEEDAGGTRSGKAYIFDVTTGNLLHTIDNPNTHGSSENDYFGGSVAISGNTCVVGAYQEEDAGGNYPGKAYVFNVTTGNLLHILDNPNAHGDPESDGFGYVVAISGNKCIVGAVGESDSSGESSGKAYIFAV